MKVERFGMVWHWCLESAKFSSPEKLVFTALCMFQNKERCCYPSVAELARLTSYSKATIARALSGLEKNGAISRTHRFNGDGKTSNSYQISDTRRERVSDEGYSHSERGVASQGELPTLTVSHKHIKEHIIEQKGAESSLFNIRREESFENSPIGDSWNFENMTKNIFTSPIFS